MFINKNFLILFAFIFIIKVNIIYLSQSPSEIYFDTISNVSETNNLSKTDHHQEDIDEDEENKHDDGPVDNLLNIYFRL